LDPDAQRKYRVAFIGNRQPPERLTKLMQCRDALVGAERQTYWHEYGGQESTGPRRLEPTQYMRVLSDTDFCISPPGWGDLYAHRTVEALIRGSIPIIDDPHNYDLEFRNKQNCILANRHDWGTAIRTALSMSDPEVLRMRRNVLALREERLLPNKAVDRFCSQIFRRVSAPR
jgi:hypothetical protein